MPLSSSESSVRDEKNILIVGYSEELKGGVTGVTKTLLNEIPETELHPYLHCYTPKYKSLFLYLKSIVVFVFRIFILNKYSKILLIIGSKGDVIRALPYIFLAKIRGIVIYAQYHKSADILFTNNYANFLKKLTYKALSSIKVHCFLSKRLEKEFLKVTSLNVEVITIRNALPNAWLKLNYDISKKNKVVFFGRWNKEKGIDDLLKCITNLPTIEFELYTDHTPENIPTNCTVNSWVNEEVAISIMKNAKLLILPSYAEAYPTVLIEALACGTPFISTNIAGIPDIANESKGGIIIQPGDVEDLATNITKLLNNEAIWKEMSLAGYEWVNKHHSIEQIKLEWRRLFKSSAA
jgi:glycosyltransferase involved in cell wall biosynthesis